MPSGFVKKLRAPAGDSPSDRLSSALRAADEAGGRCEVSNFDSGSRIAEIELRVEAKDQKGLDRVIGALAPHGFAVSDEGTLCFEESPRDGVAPAGFYSTTPHATEVFSDGQWHSVTHQRMDACIVEREGEFECVKIRDLVAGDRVVTGDDGLRLALPTASKETDEFSFMSGEVSSERKVGIAVERVADLCRDARKNGKKIIWVPGPVIVHTGAADDLGILATEGWVDGVLSGNALAVHDIEGDLLGTSLGVSLDDGRLVEGGYSHHMRAINVVRAAGDIPSAVRDGVITGGLMHALVTHQVPFILAGSIRDDGPLPDTEMDLVVAQERYAEMLTDAGVVIVLATMLHGIGVGNMLPGGVPLVCVDIHPAVVTKFGDRGSSQTMGVVTDVGLFVARLRKVLLAEDSS